MRTAALLLLAHKQQHGSCTHPSSVTMLRVPSGKARLLLTSMLAVSASKLMAVASGSDRCMSKYSGTAGQKRAMNNNSRRHGVIESCVGGTARQQQRPACSAVGWCTGEGREGIAGGIQDS